MKYIFRGLLISTVVSTSIFLFYFSSFSFPLTCSYYGPKNFTQVDSFSELPEEWQAFKFLSKQEHKVCGYDSSELWMVFKGGGTKVEFDAFLENFNSKLKANGFEFADDRFLFARPRGVLNREYKDYSRGYEKDSLAIYAHIEGKPDGSYINVNFRKLPRKESIKELCDFAFLIPQHAGRLLSDSTSLGLSQNLLTEVVRTLVALDSSILATSFADWSFLDGIEMHANWAKKLPNGISKEDVMIIDSDTLEYLNNWANPYQLKAVSKFTNDNKYIKHIDDVEPLLKRFGEAKYILSAYTLFSKRGTYLGSTRTIGTMEEGKFLAGSVGKLILVHEKESKRLVHIGALYANNSPFLIIHNEKEDKKMKKDLEKRLKQRLESYVKLLTNQRSL